MFWSGDKIKQNLNDLIEMEGNQVVDKKQIECAAICLRVGPEIFITNQDAKDNKGNTRITLKPNEQFKIPPGQFAFILTEEFVRIPKDALGLISIKAKLKFKGLINVSGFHVDPGFYGRINFGLYNTGPGEIALSRGSNAFLIWFADLESVAAKEYLRPGEKENSSIPDDLVTGISGEIFSPINVKKKIDQLSLDLIKEKVNVNYKLTGFLITVLLIILFKQPILDWLSNVDQKEELKGFLVEEIRKENKNFKKEINNKLNLFEDKINSKNVNNLETTLNERK